MKFTWFLLALASSVSCSIFVPRPQPAKSSDLGERFQGEVVVASAPISVKGPPKGFPLTRTERSVQEESRGMKKMLKKYWPYLLVPTMMSMGYAPFILSSLKMLVMHAMMINMMALNAAIFLTLRNMVFGPRMGQHVRYYNFGYKKQNHHR